MTRSNVEACSMGRSAGLAPLRLPDPAQPLTSSPAPTPVGRSHDLVYSRRRRRCGMSVAYIEGMRPRKHILVVDDNEVIRDILQQFLSRDYTVHTVGNAALAMTAIIQHQPNAILLDVRMPGVDGLS